MTDTFFSQFLLTPGTIDATAKTDITRLIQAVASAYDASGAKHGVEPHSLAFRRPLYLFTADGDDGIYVLYSNDGAVRGSTQWYYMGLRGQGQIGGAVEALMRVARRDIGLENWKAFFVPRGLLAVSDQNALNVAIAPIAERVLLSDLEDDLQRRRIVQINPVFTGRSFAVEPDLCFVLMPFRDDLRPVYDDHVKRTVEGLGLRCRRADDIFRNTAIIEDIWEQINEARVIIADLTGKNPNVFYEVGIAHTVGKDVVLITQSIDDVPFDLRHLRHIQYSYTPRGMEAFEQQLRNTLVTITGHAASGTTAQSSN